MRERKERVPPTVPAELAKLDRAIMLLGQQAKGLLKEPQQRELAQLLGGGCPSPKTAAAWKIHLKKLRREERDLFA